MLRTDFNPYRWHKSHENIKSQILSLEFTDDKGEMIPIRGDNLEIEKRIPLSSLFGTLNNFFIRPFTMRYHTMRLESVSDSMIVEVKPVNNSFTMVAYVKKGERPTVENYDHLAIVPDYSFCTWEEVDSHLVTDCSRSPYEIMSTADFKDAGLYYVGILYIDRHQLELNHTRTKRSCFGRRRQQRDCVEPKPPPVKEAVPNRTLIYNPAIGKNYSIKVRMYSCYYFALTHGEWSKDGCKVGMQLLLRALKLERNSECHFAKYKTDTMHLSKVLFDSYFLFSLIVIL